MKESGIKEKLKNIEYNVVNTLKLSNTVCSTCPAIHSGHSILLTMLQMQVVKDTRSFCGGS